MPAYIADSSVFIIRMPLPSPVQHRIITTPDVLTELKDIRSRMAFEEAVESGMNVEAPLPHLVSEIRSHARAAGEIERLSDTDIGLLAKALEYNGILYTDDYAIQNVAGRIGIKTESIAQAPIEETFEWGRRCVGCGRKFGSDINICPICGSSLAGYRKNRRRLG